MTDENEFILDDAPVPVEGIGAAGTLSIEIGPALALAAGEAHQQAVLEAVEQDGVPPLPVEPRAMSRYGRRFAEPSGPDQFEYEPYLRPRPGARPAPEGFWREYLYGVSLGLVNLGDSRPVRHREAIDARIARQIDGDGFVPVISRQGGVGATTVTALLGLALADVRDEPVHAVDAHPDRGALAERVEGSRIEVEQTHAVPEPGAGRSVILSDGASGPAMQEALERADVVVLVSGGTSEQARLTSETVSWLHKNDLSDLAENAVVALNTATPGTRYESLDAIEAHFQARVRDVVRIPYDEELVAGAPVRYGALRPDTREAARELAAKVMDGFDAGGAAA